MSLSEIVQAVLIGGTDQLLAHFEVLPSQAEIPAVTITEAGGAEDFTLRGGNGFGRFVIQLDAWASTRTGADDYMARVIAKMRAADTFSVSAINLSAADPYEEETKRFRASREFGLWIDP